MSYIKPFSWWNRNKRWLLPLFIIVGSISAFIAVIFAIIYFTVSSVKKSEPYLFGLDVAKKKSEIIYLIGEPIEPGFFVGGSIPAPNEQGFIDLSIPIWGPKGSGVILIAGDKRQGKWNYNRFLFRSNETTSVIDLREQISN